MLICAYFKGTDSLNCHIGAPDAGRREDADRCHKLVILNWQNLMFALAADKVKILNYAPLWITSIVSTSIAIVCFSNVG